MQISGIQRFTLLDFPEQVACVVFTPGCNFRCKYCHNPEFVLPEQIKKLKDTFIPEDVFFNFLATRRGLLDGVVITGGEPTIYQDLPVFMKKVKEFGFKVKLDTNGNNPDLLSQIISENIVDYIAMDIKTSLGQYQELVGPGADQEKLRKSIELIKESSVPYEFRSTLIKEVHDVETLKKMAHEITGSHRLYLQQFRPGVVLDESFAQYHPFSLDEMKAFGSDIFSPHVLHVEVRVE